MRDWKPVQGPGRGEALFVVGRGSGTPNPDCPPGGMPNRGVGPIRGTLMGHFAANNGNNRPKLTTGKVR